MTKETSIWVVGAKGLLGRALVAALARRGLAHSETDQELDISSPAAPLEYGQAQRPRWIVNCAAYTNVDGAEDERERAFAVNADGPAHLAQTAQAVGASLLQISTDYVFDGARGAYLEDAPTAPLSVYGESKLAGERHVRERLEAHVIVRTAWLYGAGGRSFVGTMLRLFQERDRLTVVADQRGSPTWVADLAEGLVRILEHPSPRYGTYHATNAGETSWHGLAQASYEEALRRGLVARAVAIEAVPSSAYPTRARRPGNSTLDCRKIREAFGVELRPWREALAAYLDQLQPHPDDPR